MTVSTPSSRAFPWRRTLVRGAFLLLGAGTSAFGAGRPGLDFHLQRLDLPGAPAAIVATDLDGDGRRDLAVAVIYTVWDQIELEERTEMDDIEGLVEVLTIVPALLDHRELFLFRTDEDGTFAPFGGPTELSTSVLSIEAGPRDRGLVALTDDGLARLVLPTAGGGAPTWELLIEETPVLAGTGAFFPPLGLIRELDGLPGEDLLLPAARGYSVYLNREGALGEAAAQTGLLPVFDDDPGRDSDAPLRFYPLAEVRDTDGDGRPDLLFPHPHDHWKDFRRAANLGRRFAAFSSPLDGFPPLAPKPESVSGGGASPPAGEDLDSGDRGSDEDAVLFEDLDGDGRSELVTQEHLERDAEGLREGLDEARRPEFRYRIYPQGADGRLVEAPSLDFQATGYALAGDPDFPFPGGFQDLDGDGRKDLVTLTLDFSVMQAVKVLATKRISIGLDFHVWCQEGDRLGFRRIRGLDLSGKFKLNLNNLRLNQLSQFAGDFDGDGRADFLQIGRGKRVSIHLGQEGCGYPAAADLAVELAEAPEDLSLVQVRDLDGDQRSDLIFIQPRPGSERESSAPVRLDLYLSGGGR